MLQSTGFAMRPGRLHDFRSRAPDALPPIQKDCSVPHSNSIALPPGARERIEAAVEAAFEAQIATTIAFAAIPSNRGQEGPCQDMFAGLLRTRGWEVDDWIIDRDELESLPGYGPVETDFSRARTVVGTWRPARETGRSLILQGHCDVVPAGPVDMWRTPPFQPVVEDGWLYGRGAGDMKSGTIAALYALDALKAAGLRPQGRIHLQSVIEEESTGLGALSTLQRGYRADACLIPEPTDGRLIRAQVGVIWFRLKVRGFPVHVARAGTGSNAIMAAYRLIQGLQELEAEWNERARTHRFFGSVSHPLNFNPGIIRGGDWASSVPAWCDVDCRIGILPGWKVADAQAEIVVCVERAARSHPFLAENPPEVVWSGFLSPGFELSGAEESEAVLAAAYASVYGGALEDATFTALTDTRFYGLDYGIPALCFGARADNIHGFNERVDLTSVKKLTKTLALFIAGWCGVEAA
jgi:acetylornithine deacetylase